MKTLNAEISGPFVKIAFADEVDIFLKHNSPKRPAARYNRLGENALYLSVYEKSARVAMLKYAEASDPPRVLIRYEVQPCEVVDLRHPDAENLRKLTKIDWQTAFNNGDEPTSWQVADEIRRSNQVGLIDPSRKNPGLWHVTLLKWNEVGAPQVTMIGEPTEIIL